MIVTRRFTITLEHSNRVLLEDASIDEVDDFWEKYKDQFFGLRIEDVCGSQPRIIVTTK